MEYSVCEEIPFNGKEAILVSHSFGPPKGSGVEGIG